MDLQGIDRRLQQSVLDAGYRHYTPIQEEAIAHALLGEDLLARAPTGTGKTAAFLIPILNRALADKTLLAIVIEPSRELAIQAANECRKIAGSLKVRAVAAYGGDAPRTAEGAYLAGLASGNRHPRPALRAGAAGRAQAGTSENPRA